MRQQVVRLLIVLAITLALIPAAQATCGGGGGGGMGGIMPRGGLMGQNEPPRAYVVPWRVLKPEEPPLPTPLTVHSFPASGDQATPATIRRCGSSAASLPARAAPHRKLAAVSAFASPTRSSARPIPTSRRR